VHLVGGRRGIHLVDEVGADDLLLHREALLRSGLGLRRGLAFEGQLHAATAEEIVGGVDEVEDLAHAHVGDGLVHDLLHLDRRDTHRQSQRPA
jgi:hypothetical protein